MNSPRFPLEATPAQHSRIDALCKRENIDRAGLVYVRDPVNQLLCVDIGRYEWIIDAHGSAIGHAIKDNADFDMMYAEALEEREVN